MVEWIGLAIGACGLTVATVSLVWQIRTRLETTRESVLLYPSHEIDDGTGHEGIEFLVINKSERPIFLDMVGLGVEYYAPRLMADGEPGETTDQHESTVGFLDPAPGEPLQPHQSRAYKIGRDEARKFLAEDLCKDRAMLFATVRTPEREILRVPESVLRHWELL